MAVYSLAELSRSGIYEIVNTVNGKRYIGSAKSIRVRWRQHRAALNSFRHHSRYLQAAWKKYGESAFEFRVVEFCDPQALVPREQSAIDRLIPAYNVCPKAGSTLGRYHSAETRNKIAMRALGSKKPPRSAEHRAAISAANKGKQKSASHAAAFQAGRIARVYTEDQRSAISEGLKSAYERGLRLREKSESHKHKIGKFYAKLSDEQVREIRTLRLAGVTCKELAKKFGSNAGTICNIASGKRYRWVE